MTVHVEAGCTCGATLVENHESTHAILHTHLEWAQSHRGPGHRPCGVDEARRIAKRERVKG